MNFEEAIKNKQTIQRVKVEGGITYELCIAPKNHSEMLNYIEIYRSNFDLIDDNIAKNYSSNNEFCLCYIAREEQPDLLYSVVSGKTI